MPRVLAGVNLWLQHLYSSLSLGNVTPIRPAQSDEAADESFEGGATAARRNEELMSPFEEDEYDVPAFIRRATQESGQTG